MAEGGDKVIIHQPKSPSLEIDPDIKKMMDAFAKMGVKLKADTLEELTDWMMGVLKLKGKIKEEPEAKIDRLYHQNQKIKSPRQLLTIHQR